MCYSLLGVRICIDSIVYKWNVQYKHSCKTVQLVIMEHVIQISQVCSSQNMHTVKTLG